MANLIIFDDSNNDGEEQYQKWLEDNLDGYVVNTTRGRRSRATYMVLHRATCKSISNYTPKKKWGCYTTGAYIKICALNIESLRIWGKANGGEPNKGFTKESHGCLNWSALA